MDYEKKYKEALQKIRELIEKGRENGWTIITYEKEFEEIFPELAESEDERIRKVLIELSKEVAQEQFFINRGTNLQNVIAWLEKQGEVVSDKDGIEAEEKDIRKAFNKIWEEKQDKQKSQRMISAEAKEAMYDKSADKVEPKFKVGDSIKTANEEPLTITEITDNGYWSEDLFICNFDDAAKWELVEQKPAWSEEDERKIQDCIDAVSRVNLFKVYYQNELVGWLKSLKTKVQPKQEWSEKDEEELEIAIDTLKESGRYDSAKWVQSLKRRIGGKL